jgi:predicted membrane protein
LLRKFLQVSVITLVYPNTRLQLFFGLILACTFALYYQGARPYNSAICSTAQLVALLQIAFTFMSANLLFEEPSQISSRNHVAGLSPDAVGWLLIFSNCVFFVFAVGFAAWTLRNARVSLVEAERTLSMQLGLSLKLQPPQFTYPDDSPGHHVFLSHVWAHAQDQGIPHNRSSSDPDIARTLNVLLCPGGSEHSEAHVALQVPTTPLFLGVALAFNLAPCPGAPPEPPEPQLTHIRTLAGRRRP